MKTKNFQVAYLRKTSNVYPEQEYELGVIETAIVEPESEVTSIHGTEAELRATLRENGVSETQIEWRFADA